MRWRRVKIISLYMSMFVCCSLSFAEVGDIPDIEIRVSIDRDTITIGDEITYSVEVENIKGGEIKFPTTVTSLGGFEVKDIQVEKKGAIYTLTNFNVGVDTIPPLKLKYIYEGEEYDLETEGLPVNVRSLLTSDIKDIKDIKPPIDIPLNKLPYILSVIGALIIGGALYYLFRKFKWQKTVVIEKEIRPAHEIAYERLDALRLDLRRIKEYYIELSDIIRRYIEARFGISAPTETTYELVTELKKRKMDYSNVTNLREFFYECDLVKFAKYLPAREDIEKDTIKARSIVDRTSEKRAQEKAMGDGQGA